MPSKIEWTGNTWNPLRARPKGQPGPSGTACIKVSAGCTNCYAERFNANRFGTGELYTVEGMSKVETFLDERALLQPLRWHDVNVFPCSLTDLYGEWIPDSELDQVFAVMAIAGDRNVIFQTLTKRAERMRAYWNTPRRLVRIANAIWNMSSPSRSVSGQIRDGGRFAKAAESLTLPLPNLWHGVTTETQATADQRIPDLLATPSRLRWLSVEPQLEPIDLYPWFDCPHWDAPDNPADGGDIVCPKCNRARTAERLGIDWVVVGGESGPRDKIRPYPSDWPRRIVTQCQLAGVPVFVKQMGSRPHEGRELAKFDWPNGTLWRNHRPVLKSPKGGDPSEWPADLRVREMPVTS